MGADLYIKDMDRDGQLRGFEVSKDAVNAGYFRDPYNDWGLFNFLRSNTKARLSWWRFAANKEWFDSKGNMSIKGAREFREIFVGLRDEIAKKDKFGLEVVDFDATHKLPKDKRRLIYKTEKLSAKEIKEYKDWLDLLIRFLDLAIRLKSKIIWSV